MTAPSPVSSRRRVWLIAVVALIAVFAVALLRFANPSMSALARETQAALDDGDARRATAKARQLVARDPEAVEGWIFLARAGILANDRESWEPAIERVGRSDPERAFDLWLQVGGEAMKRLQAGSAEHALRRALACSPDRPEPWRLLAQLLSVQGRPRETAECLLALIRLNDFTSEDLHTLAWPNSAVTDPARVEALLAADPQYLLPMLSHVGSALDQNRSADAEGFLKKIIARHPDNSRAIAVLGRLLAERDATEFQRWQKDQSSRATLEPETGIAQGIWLRNHGQISAAARCFHQAVELDPRRLDALSELGRTLQALDEPKLAAAFLDWARRQQEIMELAKRIEEQGEPRNMRKLSERLEQVGRLWEAWGWCQLYLRAFPQDASTEKLLGRLQSRLAPELPRTLPSAVPGREFNWSGLAEPDWSSGSEKAPDGEAATETAIAFNDDSTRLGIHFHFENGPAPGGTIIQTSGGGVAALDYDRDGWCDLYFTQGGHDPAASTQTAVDSLYRNHAGQQFLEVTAQATIHEDRFSQGVAAGDFDNDGFPDLYVANLGLNRLLRNNGDGTFSDVTSSANLAARGWTASCAIADLSGDGQPDLFSARYAGGPEIVRRVCRDANGRPGVCRPTLFPAETDLVAVSSGDGQYAELCDEAGLNLADGRGFGLVVADFNNDRRLDVFVANDQTANFLLAQTDADGGRLRFVDEAVGMGVAFDRDGYSQACMGVAAGDINGDGRLDLFVTNFADESDTLYLSQPHGGYMDMTRESRLRDPSFHPLGFGTQFLDADLDGGLDLVVLNGHILDATEFGKPPAMLPQLYRGLANGRFEPVLEKDPKGFFNTPRVGRGLCWLDWNGDGLPEFAGSFLDGKAVLATNRTAAAGHWLAMEFAGVQSSRDAIGTRVKLVFTDGKERLWQLSAGDGFAASNQRRLHLGLGPHARVSRLEIIWPSGLSQQFRDVQADTLHLAVEGRSELHPLPLR